ncbi:MAG: hypothetical protein KDA51_09290, partial [Planctomycetales bacterium]|nr:hypothetical protein [Planctomycetales bacterium]
LGRAFNGGSPSGPFFVSCLHSRRGASSHIHLWDPSARSLRYGSASFAYPGALTRLNRATRCSSKQLPKWHVGPPPKVTLVTNVLR